MGTRLKRTYFFPVRGEIFSRSEEAVRSESWGGSHRDHSAAGEKMKKTNQLKEVIAKRRSKLGKRALAYAAAAAVMGGTAATADADFVDDYDPALWSFGLGGGDGSFTNDGALLTLTGSDDGVGPDITTYTVTAAGSGTVSFNWDYSSTAVGNWDYGGFVLNGVFTTLANNSAGGSGTQSFTVNAGDTFGFFVTSQDSQFGAGVLEISNFNAPAGIPEPSAITILALGTVGLIARRKRCQDEREERRRRRRERNNKC